MSAPTRDTPVDLCRDVERHSRRVALIDRLCEIADNVSGNAGTLADCTSAMGHVPTETAQYLARLGLDHAQALRVIADDIRAEMLDIKRRQDHADKGA